MSLLLSCGKYGEAIWDELVKGMVQKVRACKDTILLSLTP